MASRLGAKLSEIGLRTSFLLGLELALFMELLF